MLFTDTDSLCYSIKTDDIYSDMRATADDRDQFDFSDYPLIMPTTPSSTRRSSAG